MSLALCFLKEGHPKHTYVMMVKYLEKWEPVTEESTGQISILYFSLLTSVIYGSNDIPLCAACLTVVVLH